MKQLTSDDFLDDLLPQDKPSLLFFSASWCGPCQSMTSVVSGISNLMSERLYSVKVDVNTSENEVRKYGIRSVPTLLLIKNDEIIAQQVGAMPAHRLMQWIEQYI